MFQPDGLLGDLNRALWHIHNGTLFYSGFEVLPPFVAWSPVHCDEQMTDAAIKAYGARLLGAGSEAPMRFHPTADFDSTFKLRPEIEPVSAGHWRPSREKGS